MKTTIDLPAGLLQRAKITAAQLRTTLKELVVQGLEYATRHEFSDPETERKTRNHALLEGLSAIRIGEPVGKLNRDEIHDRHDDRWK